MERVFVYGTLKSGYGNNRLLASSEFIGEAVTEEAFHLCELGAFPGMLEADEHEGDPLLVSGEVWEVDEKTFASLDRLEGHPTFYKRRTLDTSEGKAWGYIYQGHPRELCNVVDGKYNWSR